MGIYDCRLIMKPNIIYGNFSMGQIDEVSSKLGGIEATQNLILKSLHTIESAYNDTREKTTLHGSSIEAAHKRIDKMEPVLEEYETNRDKGKGMWYLVVGAWTFLTSGIGAYIANIIFP